MDHERVNTHQTRFLKQIVTAYKKHHGRRDTHIERCRPYNQIRIRFSTFPLLDTLSTLNILQCVREVHECAFYMTLLKWIKRHPYHPTIEIQYTKSIITVNLRLYFEL